jgi:hypothetical protein
VVLAIRPSASPLEGPPGVIYDFCVGRGAQYPLAFLCGQGPPYAEPAWRGTLLSDQYAAYGPVLDPKVHPYRRAAGCAAHARRYFEELTKPGVGASAVAQEAMQRWARIYSIERFLADVTPEERLEGRQRLSLPLWEELRAWLQLERRRVAGVSSGSDAATHTKYELVAVALQCADRQAPRRLACCHHALHACPHPARPWDRTARHDRRPSARPATRMVTCGSKEPSPQLTCSAVRGTSPRFDAHRTDAETGIEVWSTEAPKRRD